MRLEIMCSLFDHNFPLFIFGRLISVPESDANSVVPCACAALWGCHVITLHYSFFSTTVRAWW
jgi:hypothetical protein